MLTDRLLREQVYTYLREKIASGDLSPGASINLSALSKELQVSSSPLRDAMIQLDLEGFVKITPRRGIIVKPLTFEEIRDLYQVIGALEVSVFHEVFDLLDGEKSAEMQRLNDAMKKGLAAGNHEKHYYLNRDFHNVYLDLSKNNQLRSIIHPLKERLLDFRKRQYDVEWELLKCGEHQLIIDAIKARDVTETARVTREIHWNADAQEQYVRRFFLKEAV